MHIRLSIAALLALALPIFCPGRAAAGPPLICHEIPIGTALSLPWVANGSWNGADPAYDLSRLGDDTVDILAHSKSPDVHKETLRRAAIYSARQMGLSDLLTIRLLGRALATPRDPGALFDAGYFVETLRQAALVYTMLHGPQQAEWLYRFDDQQLDGAMFMRKAQSQVDGGIDK